MCCRLYKNIFSVGNLEMYKAGSDHKKIYKTLTGLPLWLEKLEKLENSPFLTFGWKSWKILSFQTIPAGKAGILYHNLGYIFFNLIFFIGFQLDRSFVSLSVSLSISSPTLFNRLSIGFQLMLTNHDLSLLAGI